MRSRGNISVCAGLARGCALLAAVAALGAHGRAAAQSPASTPQTGLHYYAVENLDTGQVEQRGTTGNNGIAFSNLIVAPNTPYRIWILQASTQAVASVSVITPGNGRMFQVPAFDLRLSRSRDRDDDGLHDEGELILGTINDPENERTRDSDEDGILDGAEVVQGQNPLDGFPTRTGLIQTADTPGRAVDVCAANDLVAVADSDRGVTIFNVFNAMPPLAIAQVDTPGNATRVACGVDIIAVADGSRGLAVIDVSDPPTSSIRHQVSLGSPSRAVALARGVAYVGLASGELAAVDVLSGGLVGQAAVGGDVHDVGVEGDVVYVLFRDQIWAYSAFPEFERLGTVATSVRQPEGITGRKRLFVGGGIASVTSFPGYDTLDVSDPRSMRLIAPAQDVNLNSFKHIVVNGSGLGVAAVGVNPRDDGTHHVSLYDVSDPGNTTDFLTTFTTPGLARAVAIYNGLGYVADSDAGLQVANYLAFDAMGFEPSIALSTNLAGGVAEEGTAFRVSAAVADDVQVRNVEFFIDGERRATDGNFPFELGLRAPFLRDQLSFTVRARASDTGGNFAFSETLSFELVPDATPPRLVRTTPGDGAIGQGISTVVAFFNEAIDTATLNEGSFALIAAGADGAFDSADDVAVAGTRSLLDEVFGAVFNASAPLPPGPYRGQVTTALADLAGNRLARAATWQFSVFDIGADRDRDGVPDSLEEILDLDPDNPDSDGDGLPDGQEDFDGDGLTNFGEVVLGTDPGEEDSDGDDVLDGDEDTDMDGITDGDEILRGTNPRQGDTDRDGWPDGVEVEAKSDPLSRVSRPRLVAVAVPRVEVVRPGIEVRESLPANTTLAMPPVGVSLQATGGAGDLAPNVAVAMPPVGVSLQAIGGSGDLVPNVAVAMPPVGVSLQAIGGSGDLVPNVAVAMPPVGVTLQAVGGTGDVAPNISIAQPPVAISIANP